MWNKEEPLQTNLKTKGIYQIHSFIYSKNIYARLSFREMMLNKI